MAKKQKIYSNEFKFKVIKDVLRDEMPIIQVANKHNITPKNIYNWRDQFEKKGSGYFFFKRSSVRNVQSVTEGVLPLYNVGYIAAGTPKSLTFSQN